MERIGDEIQRELRRQGGGSGPALAEIVAAWPGVVGEAISRRAWPARIGRDGTLHVSTASSTWAFELDRMSREIAERLAKALGPAAPGKLRFRPGPIPEEAAPPARAAGPEPPEQPLPEAPEVVAEAARAASTIEDEELRELVARAARASLARARGSRRI